MSRLANYPLKVPPALKADFSQGVLTVARGKDQLEVAIHPDVELRVGEDGIRLNGKDSLKNKALVGTMFALVRNALVGLSEGYSRKLVLQGVGFRATLKGDTLELNLGYSHPVIFQVPKGVAVSVPSATEIVLQSIDKQLLGQVVAQIRSARRPDAYKGKGVRYEGEQLKLKETKKKK